MAGTPTIGRHDYECSGWLGEQLADAANEALTAQEEHRYTLAITKAGACLEGVLGQLLQEWGVAAPRGRTLGQLIGDARESGKAPDALLERLNEARGIRNRAPHPRPHPLEAVTEADALQMLTILDLVICWRNEAAVSPASATGEGLPMFLSTGRPHRLDQEQFLNRLRAYMRLLEVDLRSLAGGEYSREAPFEQIASLLKTCRGALVVGMERSHAYTVFERENSDEEALHENQIVPTAWNQIGGSMASALDLPVLVLRQTDLHNEGIFEATNHRRRIREFSLAAESKGLTHELAEYLKGWVRAVRTGTA